MKLGRSQLEDAAAKARRRQAEAAEQAARREREAAREAQARVARAEPPGVRRPDRFDAQRTPGPVNLSGGGPRPLGLEDLRAARAAGAPAAAGAPTAALAPAEAEQVNANGLTPEQQAQVDEAVEELRDASEAIELGDDADDTGGDAGERKQEAVLEFSRVLADTLEDLPRELRGAVLEETGDEIEHFARGIVALSTDDTHAAVANLSRAAEAAGPLAASMITDPVAAVIADDGLIQNGEEAGNFDTNKHHSEREFVDGIERDLDAGGSRLFQAALTQSLQARDGVDDWVAAVATADAGNIDGNFTDDLREAGQDVVDAVADAGQYIVNAAGDFVRERLAAVLQIDDRIGELDSVGDTFTIGASGTVGGASLQGGLGVEMVVTRTEDGFSLAISGEASAGIFGSLGVGQGGGSIEGNLTGRVTHEFNFGSEEDVTRAAETIAGIGLATVAGGAVLGPVGAAGGAVLTALTAGDELGDLQSALAKSTYELELSAEANASFGTELQGLGLSVEGAATNSIAVEVAPGEDPVLVLDQGISLEGTATLGAIPGAPQAPSVNGTASGEISIETRIPLDGVGLASALSDPLGTLREVGASVLDDAETEVSAQLELQGGATINGGPVDANASGGLTAELTASGRTRDFLGALGNLATGNLPGALETLGTDVTVGLEVTAFSQTGLAVDEEVEGPEVRAELGLDYNVRQVEELINAEGTPLEVLEAQRDFLVRLAGGIGGTLAAA